MQYIKSLGLLLKENRNMALFVGALALIAGILESIGLSAFIPLIISIAKGDALSAENGLIKIINKVPYINVESLEVTDFFLIVIGLFVVKSMVQYTLEVTQQRLTLNYEKNFILKFYKALINTKYEFFSDARNGEIFSLINKEISEIAHCIFASVRSFSSFLTAMTYIGLAALVSIKSMIGLGFFVLLWPLFNFLNTRAKGYYQKALNHRLDFNSQLNEDLNGLSLFKSMSLESEREKLFKKSVETAFSLNKVAAYYEGAVRSMPQPLGLISIIGIFYINTQYFNISPINFSITILLIYRAYNSFMIGLTNMQTATRYLPAVEFCKQYYAKLQENEYKNDGKDVPERINSITCKDLTFNYSGRPGDQAVLNDINCTFKRGHITSIVGKSGGGKSTLLNILTGLINTKKNELLINDKNHQEFNLVEYRKLCSVVSQDTFLINGSIKENLELFAPNASPKEMKELLKRTLPEIYEGTENILDYHVGEGGKKLSGGQRQRLSLTRALLRRPQILILDEATSAVDKQTEQVIKDIISEIKHSMITILVSHSFETIDLSDYCYLLSNGEIIKEGLHNSEMKEQIYRFYQQEGTL